MTELILERRSQVDESLVAPGIMLTPDLDEDYWAYRVRLSERQAIVGFPKFLTIGIGFAVEEDWNTNFPYSCSPGEIFDHIIRNKGDDSISDEDVFEAIRLIQEAVRDDGGPR